MIDNKGTNEIRWECARPNEEDAAQVFSWRNDPTTRQMSFHTGLRTWEDFYPSYLSRSFSLPDLPPLFALWKGQRAAFLFFESANHPINPRRRCCMLSINVAPEFRGQGLGAAILKEIREWIRQRGYDTVLGEIKQENTASLKAFEKAGFSLVASQSKIYEEGKDPAPIFLVGVELTPRPAFPASVYIIAEAGSNWRLGSFERDLAMAKSLIEAAAEAGADAVKFQVYRPETVYVPNAGSFKYLEKCGMEENITGIFADLSMPYEMIPLLAEHCSKYNLDFLSTAFSIKDFDEVDPYVKIHKIASYEIGHVRLLERAAKSKKPLILSTGAATESEIAAAVDYFRRQGGTELILLQCTAAYPAPDDEINLSAIPWLKRRFQVQVGLSDHSRDPFCAPVAAAALGAVVIEKHFTLHRKLPGPDHFFAITPDELKILVNSVRTTYKMLGRQAKDISPCEQELRQSARRGVQALHDILPGDLLEEGMNAAILRPGRQPLGMSPMLLDHYKGRRFLKPVAQGCGIQPSDLEI